MEKCSMCIQMTQATILNAKREGREVDGEFQTACSNACSMEQWLLEMLMIKK
jgi:molybdopterin-containing oxidoreductase family iron-sulfur binding subunit